MPSWRTICTIATADFCGTALGVFHFVSIYNFMYIICTATSTDYLWKHFVLGLDYAEIAEEENLSYDSARMRIGRCLDEAKALVA
jgi:hypothetical protein